LRAEIIPEIRGPIVMSEQPVVQALEPDTHATAQTVPKGIKVIYMNHDDESVLTPDTEPPTERDQTVDSIKTEGGDEPKAENGEDSKKREPGDDTIPSKPKKSRKLQGVGVKKPLYSRYETLFIIKAFKSISEIHPNLVLIDLFKIVALMFNEEAKRQGFKERTADQLYQKYKRIQHGLNHGELEFIQFFKRNKHNQKEWLPNFADVADDEILKYITFPKLQQSIDQVLGSSVSNLKPPLDEEEGSDDEYDEELLKLAGFKEEPMTLKQYKSLVKTLQTQIQSLGELIRCKDSEISGLHEGNLHRDNEISFLKSLLKEELSYIRHKLNEHK
jgi:hypothetical protein